MAIMPPEPRAYHGLAEAERLCRLAFDSAVFGEWRVVLAGANRQPATASYHRAPGDDRYRAFKIDVLRVAHGKIAATTTFDATLFAAFGLPEVLSEERG